ncbi:alpha/beta fold hydrolase [Rhodovulum sp. BSW8]|uniref:Alpha/beta fold hydrolase n=1 Tax=Rhodovulum visakhapatnamense TaxID=364297 RepID=A0ABS1RFA9_9RHOB|nr:MULTISPECIES: alpha/beta fold hydrolase [Rhodovulum]MBL3569443.1 alpha/beta fold hydrolase [Rhodovulum visakhapatnamense]MBL3578336.1 alpha/beta fold hydrolase [Rhodovulum visakhapatnamense]OLS45905.1 esterase [Rhodovulum sulfidophilum]RBO51606.1 alpha/beta fold hydrolase [Rhodovulum sp. BSW8]
MTAFLLIHGSCHGAWCWRDVLPALRNAGAEARAIDLPSHGDDPTPLADVTLDLYADAILDAIDEPVILVGHSMAGFPISAAAEKAPEKIRSLVYVCAYVPVAGLSLVDMRRAGPRQPLLDAIVKSEDGVSFSFDPEKVRDKLFHDCPHEAVAYAKARLGPQPILPQATPIALSERYRSVPKRYIRCLQDRTIPPDYQATMTADWPADRIDALNCSHSPFLAQPEALAALLLRAAG